MLIGLIETAPQEVQEAIKSFRDQDVDEVERDAISDFINVKKPLLDAA